MQQSPDRVLAVTLDVTRPNEVVGVVQAALARFGRIDVLVNNAGFGLVGAGLDIDTPARRWRH